MHKPDTHAYIQTLILTEKHVPFHDFDTYTCTHMHTVHNHINIKRF